VRLRLESEQDACVYYPQTLNSRFDPSLCILFSSLSFDSVTDEGNTITLKIFNILNFLNYDLIFSKW
jgi:hypothetical protein